MPQGFWAVNFGMAYDRYSIYPHNYIIYEPPLRGFVVSDVGEVYGVQTDFMLDLEVGDIEEIYVVSNQQARSFRVEDINKEIYNVADSPGSVYHINAAKDSLTVGLMPTRSFLVQDAA